MMPETPIASGPSRAGGLNKWGVYICGPCRSNDHLGTRHVGLCSCSCDGRHDAKGRLLA